MEEIEDGIPEDHHLSEKTDDRSTSPNTTLSAFFQNVDRKPNLMYNVIRTIKNKVIFIESGLPATKAEKHYGNSQSR